MAGTMALRGTSGRAWGGGVLGITLRCHGRQQTHRRQGPPQHAERLWDTLALQEESPCSELPQGRTAPQRLRHFCMSAVGVQRDPAPPLPASLLLVVHQRPHFWIDMWRARSACPVPGPTITNPKTVGARRASWNWCIAHAQHRPGGALRTYLREQPDAAHLRQGQT